MYQRNPPGESVGERLGFDPEVKILAIFRFPTGFTSAASLERIM